ncbi:hypothetical protein [Psychroserpens sp.]|uniref:hypothetical protein n=1 Tax=Psychroserpens sp. TaxID=2020870 RepID=UPI001B192734|nr:hypothetical protein [Psychroserpens sp.]MBO6606738.1 hypothetical protein [Psychroserpens sp.]MBO6632293.1 hypothetical protein [Psychroserpens sp.]MBO6653441.1 hypothetical protein [Psychroserpens sp.]MBO6680531.1 hypothetical protein [Psychroserpens sp.]MBO6750510.1 hypothetical protein [Psychroserpens sp.]
MMDNLLHTIPNLKPFDFNQHHAALFIDQKWVLVNGISEKKSIYMFRDNNILEIYRKASLIETSWNRDDDNIFNIETEDGHITVKAYFKDDDILVLSHQDKEEFALFINTSNYDEDVNTIDDVQNFLKDKYKQKVSSLIHGHEFYYISKSREFGPFTVEKLAEKVKQKAISAYCFVRDINENDYSKRMRINDLIQEL